MTIFIKYILLTHEIKEDVIRNTNELSWISELYINGSKGSSSFCQTLEYKKESFYKKIRESMNGFKEECDPIIKNLSITRNISGAMGWYNYIRSIMDQILLFQKFKVNIILNGQKLWESSIMDLSSLM